MLYRLLIAGVTMIAAATSLWGWGWLARRAARAPALPAALTVAAGLAVYLLIGGVLNVAHMAYGRAFDAVLAGGLGLAGWAWWRAGRPRPRLGAPGAWLAAVPIAAVAVLLIVYLVPQASYNYHDDFEKYFAHPVKMIALGTLPPNFLGSLGMETLGGQAVLQAFVAAHWPVAYLGAVDAVFGLLLCMLVAGYAFKPGRWAVGAIAAELIVFAINPQIVNISSLYSGALLMMAAVGLVAHAAGEETDRRPSALLLGLVYAGILALKTSFAPFIAVHGLSVLACGPFRGRSRARWALQVAGWSAAFLAPWIALHAPLYLAAPQPPPQLLSEKPPYPFDPFSPGEMGYRATPLHYTALGLVCAALAVWAAVAAWSRRAARGWTTAGLAVAGLAGAAIYFAYVSIVGPRMFHDPGAVRYACPALLAVVPLGIRLLRAGGGRGQAAVAAALGLALAGSFWTPARQRIEQWRQYRVALAYFHKGDDAIRQFDLDYARETMSGSLQPRLAKIQALVPAGEPLAAWVMAPFWLDFRRNPIAHVDPAGLTTRWAHVPERVQYFLFEYRGYAVRPDAALIDLATGPGRLDRTIGVRALDFLDDFKGRAVRAEALYQDENYVLLRLAEPWGPRLQP